jgi:hypothetical protein
MSRAGRCFCQAQMKMFRKMKYMARKKGINNELKRGNGLYPTYELESELLFLCLALNMTL